MLPAYVTQLLNKHIGSTLNCVYIEEGRISLKIGSLETVLSDKIILKLNSDNSKVTLNFFEKDELILLNIYNSNNIDLIRGKKPFTMDEKLKLRELKTQMMSNIKKFIEKEVYVVYKTETKHMINRGLLTNMGVSGVVIKPAPFYNAEEHIYYRHILHIYSPAGNDLLNVKLQTQG